MTHHPGLEDKHDDTSKRRVLSHAASPSSERRFLMTDMMVDSSPSISASAPFRSPESLSRAVSVNVRATFTGFVALGAMVLPGGTIIVHAPVFSSEALVEISTDDTTRLLAFLLLIGAVIIVMIVVAIAAVTTTGKKMGKGDQGAYERSKSSQPGDWSKYYNKK